MGSDIKAKINSLLTDLADETFERLVESEQRSAVTDVIFNAGTFLADLKLSLEVIAALKSEAGLGRCERKYLRDCSIEVPYETIYRYSFNDVPVITCTVTLKMKVTDDVIGNVKESLRFYGDDYIDSKSVTSIENDNDSVVVTLTFKQSKE